MKIFTFVKENDLRNLLQKKKLEKEERYRVSDYKHHPRKESMDNDLRDAHMKIRKREEEEEEERDNRRSHRERDQYIEQYYKMIDRPRKYFN